MWETCRGSGGRAIVSSLSESHKGKAGEALPEAAAAAAVSKVTRAKSLRNVASFSSLCWSVPGALLWGF